MKKIILILFTMALSLSIFCQSRKESKNYDVALKLSNEGQYKEAISILKEIIRNDKNYVLASWTLSDIYEKMNNDEKRISTLVYVAKPNISQYYNTVFRLATAYNQTCNYKKAIETYKIIPKTEIDYYKRASKRIKQCEEALELLAHPVPFNVKNIGNAINTEFDDYWPSTTADESYFSSTIKLNKKQGESGFMKAVHEDIFLSKKENGVWGKTVNVGNAINSIGNEGAQSISLDGRYMFFVACDRQNGVGRCDIYYSIREGDKWSNAINAGTPLNSKYWETYPSLSPTGDEIYFASNRPGGAGKSDIWKCKVEIKNNGQLSFSDPVNLGPTINTPEDEFSPFIHADNHTLYYSSKGMKGLGGYDVYISYKTDTGWTAPQNIGYPINTCKDEFGFIVNANGDKAYFSSDGQEKNDQGRDIYELKLQEGNLRPYKKMKYATGKIVDAQTNKPMQAKIDVYSIGSNEAVSRSVSDKSTGDFIACVPENEEYGVNVSKKGYLFYSDNLIDKDVKKKQTEITKEGRIVLDKIEVGKKITLKNIFFDFDQFSLKKESFLELDRVALFMKENPTVKIQLSGHTDYKGTRDYNLTLSENRAKSAFDYLSKKGVPKSRLKYKGYGPDQPIANNKTDEGRALNRRTEIMIIEK